ncbi:hypothetical protein [Paenibacillus terrae]|uniref:Uncharacterized protein n=1 Tax=Paenibacillus terrae TaxID=159743 RepID=A0A0D7X7A7_9BACL|nr:hypothetical protein [Paenibacillus terrae]KJD45887.1 hypothetical protein QD47_09620 [Paenibacillus terrae]
MNLKNFTTRNRIVIKYDPKMENSVPSPLIVRNMLEGCSVNNFDEAKKEFDITDVIDSTSDNFSNRCQLCHTSNLKHNFVLHNRITGRTLHVGSRCIIRFNVLKGAVDVSSGIALLQNKADEHSLKHEIQSMVGSIIFPTMPEAIDYNKFIKKLHKYFEVRGISKPTVEQLGLLILGNEWANKSEELLMKIKNMWYDPGKIETLKTKKVAPLNNPKEGTTWSKKRTLRTENVSAARSLAYDTEQYVMDYK